MLLMAGFKNQWDIYDRYAEGNSVVENLEALRFKLINTSRSRAMDATSTAYTFESMQEDGLRFSFIVEDAELEKLKTRADFKSMLRGKCIGIYKRKLEELEIERRNESFALETGDII